MQRRKGLIFPRIAEEIVNPAEIQKVWNCGYLTVNRIMYGRKKPNHIQKEQLSEYLGIPVKELWIRVDPDPIPEWYAYKDSYEPVELTEEEKREHLKQYQHEYYLNNTKPKRAEIRLAKVNGGNEDENI